GDYMATEELQAAISNPEYLPYLTIKYAWIKDELLSSKYDGPCYSYTHLKVGSGAIYLGLCLEAYGFYKFNGRSSAFKKQQKPPKGNPACTPETEDLYCTPQEIKQVSIETEINEDFEPHLRYAILTSQMT